MISFFSAKKSFLDVKIIIFIEQRADVQEYPNPPNITNYMSQNIIVFTLTAEVEMEISSKSMFYFKILPIDGD